VLVPPVIIFLVLLLGSLLGSISTLFYIFGSHQRGDSLWFENQYVELEFPKNWVAAPLENINSTAGNTFSAVFFEADAFLAMGITVYDKMATQTFFNKYNFTDTRSILFSEANKTYTDILQSSKNATLEIMENGTRLISNSEADYAIYLIRNGYIENNVSKNISYMSIFYINNQQLIQLAYWGNEDEFGRQNQIFETFLSQLRVKT
jgi:hypothetical protein